MVPTMRLVVTDVDSPSYFVATADVDALAQVRASLKGTSSLPQPRSPSYTTRPPAAGRRNV